MFFQKLLHPSKWVLIFVPPLSFAALIFIFATQTTRSASAYMIYCLCRRILLRYGLQHFHG